MKILMIGGGGREHALLWKLRQSPAVEALYCAPGNAGIKDQAACIDIGPTQIGGLADFAEKEGIGLTVVGPELPLTLGIVEGPANQGELLRRVGVVGQVTVHQQTSLVLSRGKLHPGKDQTIRQRGGNWRFRWGTGGGRGRFSRSGRYFGGGWNRRVGGGNRCGRFGG